MVGWLTVALVSVAIATNTIYSWVTNVERLHFEIDANWT